MTQEQGKIAGFIVGKVHGDTPMHREEEFARLSREIPEQAARAGIDLDPEPYCIDIGRDCPDDVAHLVIKRAIDEGWEGAYRVGAGINPDQCLAVYVIISGRRMLVGAESDFRRNGLGRVVDELEAQARGD